MRLNPPKTSPPPLEMLLQDLSRKCSWCRCYEIFYSLLTVNDITDLGQYLQPGLEA